MTNFELELEFEKVFNTLDCFDSYIKLKQLKKIYKKSDFYKQTHLPINKAYQLYLKNNIINIMKFFLRLNNTEEVGNMISNYINNIDPDIIYNFFNKISELFSVDQLKELQNQLNLSMIKLKTE